MTQNYLYFARYLKKDKLIIYILGNKTIISDQLLIRDSLHPFGMTYTLSPFIS